MSTCDAVAARRCHLAAGRAREGKVEELEEVAEDDVEVGPRPPRVRAEQVREEVRGERLDVVGLVRERGCQKMRWWRYGY